jgi:hypothetical protein
MNINQIIFFFHSFISAIQMDMLVEAFLITSQYPHQSPTPTNPCHPLNQSQAAIITHLKEIT